MGNWDFDEGLKIWWLTKSDSKVWKFYRKCNELREERLKKIALTNNFLFQTKLRIEKTFESYEAESLSP